MWKVALWALLLAGLIRLIRDQRSKQLLPLWDCVRGALWGAFYSAVLAILFTLCSTPGPYQLSIFIVALNMLLVPSFMVVALIRSLRRQPEPAQETQSFQGMLDEIQQSSQSE